jgi:RNA polymerase sigma factor (TIGR02999 family)
VKAGNTHALFWLNRMLDKPITQYLQELRDGGRDTLDELLPLVYAELRRLANSYLSRERENHTLQPTALVHEAYLRLIGQNEIAWQNRAHFFGVSARLMREILIEYARGRNRQKRGGEFKTQIALDDAIGFTNRKVLDVVAVDEALSKLEKLDERQARIVEMKFFGGLTVDEIGEVLDISTATVKREWSTAKLILHRMLD